MSLNKIKSIESNKSAKRIGRGSASGSGKTGDIQLTTTGHSSGDTYMIVLHCIKSYG